MTVAVGGQDEQEGMMQVQVEGNYLKGKEIINRDYFDDGANQYVVFLARDKTSLSLERTNTHGSDLPQPAKVMFSHGLLFVNSSIIYHT